MSDALARGGRAAGWLDALAAALERDGAVARVVVASVRGSAPREPGACMLVFRDPARPPHGTVGGGHLEWKAIALARRLLDDAPGAGPRLDRFPLGATLGQCCGGAVELWFERWERGDLALAREAIDACRRGPATLATRLAPVGGSGPPRRVLREADASAPDPSGACARLAREPGDERAVTVLRERLDAARPALWLFGAGHVGAALVRVLGTLPVDVAWIDAREAQWHAGFPEGLPANVVPTVTDDPAADVAAAPPGAYFLVMTHSHDLDFEIVRALLARDDFAWAGLIGSATKAARFAQRLAQRGVARERFARISCPIGVPGLRGKAPSTIAVSVAAQLLQAIETAGVRQAERRAGSPST